jgi:hypothetical protein
MSKVKSLKIKIGVAVDVTIKDIKPCVLAKIKLNLKHVSTVKEQKRSADGVFGFHMIKSWI